MAAKLKDCSEGHRFAPLIDRALRGYSDKERMFEGPIKVGILQSSCNLY